MRAKENFTALVTVAYNLNSANTNDEIQREIKEERYGYKEEETRPYFAPNNVKQGILDKATANSFRKNILENGASEDPMVLCKRFKGSDPGIDAMLVRRGLKRGVKVRIGIPGDNVSCIDEK